MTLKKPTNMILKITSNKIKQKEININNCNFIKNIS